MDTHRIFKTSFASVYPLYVHLDKLVDELAKGKPMEKILRT